jgi:signal transduction histidine kinase
VALFDDVTERRLAEEQREDLIRAVTHDLRTPLSVVRTSAELMQRLPAAAAERVDPILRSCRSMEAMLADLADASRIDARHVELERRAVDLGALLSDLVKRLEPVLDTRRVRLRVPDDPLLVEADPLRVERVLVNLVTNALKYSPPESEVLMDAGRTGSHVSIEVLDHGQGIDPEDLPRVFDRFFRAKEARRTDGLGLGLFIARALVEAHGGTIQAESTPGSGSRFRVLLPALAAEPDPRPQ